MAKIELKLGKYCHDTELKINGEIIFADSLAIYVSNDGLTEVNVTTPLDQQMKITFDGNVEVING